MPRPSRQHNIVFCQVKPGVPDNELLKTYAYLKLVLLHHASTGGQINWRSVLEKASRVADISILRPAPYPIVVDMIANALHREIMDRSPLLVSDTGMDSDTLTLVGAYRMLGGTLMHADGSLENRGWVTLLSETFIATINMRWSGSEYVAEIGVDMDVPVQISLDLYRYFDIPDYWEADVGRAEVRPNSVIVEMHGAIDQIEACMLFRRYEHRLLGGGRTVEVRGVASVDELRRQYNLNAFLLYSTRDEILESMKLVPETVSLAMRYAKTVLARIREGLNGVAEVAGEVRPVETVHVHEDSLDFHFPVDALVKTRDSLSAMLVSAAILALLDNCYNCFDDMHPLVERVERVVENLASVLGRRVGQEVALAKQ